MADFLQSRGQLHIEVMTLIDFHLPNCFQGCFFGQHNVDMLANFVNLVVQLFGGANLQEKNY